MACTIAFALCTSMVGMGDGPARPLPAIVWDERTVEHLYNRAAFGARADEIAHGLAVGPERLVDELITDDVRWQDLGPKLFLWEDMGFTHRQLPLAGSPFNALPSDQQVAACKEARLVDRTQFFDVTRRWFAQCYANRAPVRNRMTLFWHSLFTTSSEVNKRKFEILLQFQWMRREALSSYAELLHGIVRDPAMLQYYDNTGNYKEHPNENFARELLELYSLGEGNYSEHDVREAARALTGYAGSSVGTFELLSDRHDEGEKTILGRTGNFDAEDLVEILLEQPACSRYIAARLLRYFEGVEPDEARLADYAAFLRENDWRIEPFLRRLFLDPRFYREEILGARVASPIEFYANVCHKLGHEPPIAFTHEATKVMGQVLYAPPSVKGWPEGLAWMASDALLRRGNCVAILVGALEPRALLDAAALCPQEADPEVFAEDGGDPHAMGALGMGAAREAELEYDRLRQHVGTRWWSPRAKLLSELRAAGIRTDQELVDRLLEDWLAVSPDPAVSAVLTIYLARDREELGVTESELLDRPSEFDAVLRRLAQVIFSLPEAQLL